MPSPRRLVTRSLASTIAPELLVHRELEIEKIANPIKQLAATAIHRTTVKHPRLMSKLHGIAYQPCVMPFQGFGYDCVVLQDGDDVIKLHPRSLFMGEADKYDYARQKSEQFATQYRYLGAFMLEQSVKVVPHPVVQSISIVQTRQPFVPDFSDARLTGKSLQEPFMERLESFHDEFPTAAAQLPGFVEAGKACGEQTDMWPDIEGGSNLVVDNRGDNLLLLDGQPIVDQRWDYIKARIKLQFNELELGLQYLGKM